MPDFLQQLKHRHVVRAALIYAAAVWALAQGIAQLSPVFGLSAKVTLWFVIACVIGFPFWIAIAWFFRFTPHGIAREDDAAKDAAATRRAGRKLDYWIIGIMAVAIVLLLTNQLVLQRGKTIREFTATTSAQTALASLPIPAKSVAVLPFENLSADKNNAYFVDGIQDLILTKLADIGDLKVTARTSTERYGTHPANLALVGKQLGVATILEGSVQKVGDQVLINLQLIDAKTDSHIWAQSYQRTLKNIFSVEGEVAAKVATALNTKLTQAESVRIAMVSTRNPVAYDAFFKGEYYARQGAEQSSKADYHLAFNFYRKAVVADPGYALAWAQLASRQLEYIHFFGNQAGLSAQAKSALDQALILQPHLEQAHVAQGLYRMFAKREDISGAAAAFATARALKPQDWFPVFLGGVLEEDQGHWRAAIELFRRASALNPRQLPPLTEMAHDYGFERRYAQAVRVLKHALAVDPVSWHATAQLVSVYALAGNLDAMRAVLEAAPRSVKNAPLIVSLHAQYLIYRRDWTGARRAVLAAQTAGPQSAQTACQLGEVAYRLHRVAQARSYYQHCVDLARKNKQFGYEGLALVHLGQTEQALASGRRGVAKSAFGRMDEQAAALLLMARIEAHADLAKHAVVTLDHLLSLNRSGNYVSVPLLKLDPVWDSIRHDPAFQALLKKYGKRKSGITNDHLPDTSNGGARH